MGWEFEWGRMDEMTPVKGVYEHMLYVCMLFFVEFRIVADDGGRGRVQSSLELFRGCAPCLPGGLFSALYATMLEIVARNRHATGICFCVCCLSSPRVLGTFK